MDTEENEFQRYRPRRVSTVLGRPELLSEEENSRENNQTIRLDTTKSNNAYKRPNIMIEQFQRRSSQSSSRSRSLSPESELQDYSPSMDEDNTNSSNSAKRDYLKNNSMERIERKSYTTSVYPSLPVMFKQIHPLEPGGGIRTPEEFDTPIVPPELDKEVKKGSIGSKSRNSSGHRRTERENASTSSSKSSQRSHQLFSKESSFSTIDNNKMPETLDRAHRKASGGGLYAPQRSFASNRTHTQSISSQKPEEQIEKNGFTTPVYPSLPGIFKQIHPLEPGGGIRTPEEFGAPIVPPELDKETKERSFGSKSRSSGRRSTESENVLTTSRRDSQRLHELVNKESSFSTIDNNQKPNAFRRGHASASGGGLYSSSRSFVPNLRMRKVKNRTRNESMESKSLNRTDNSSPTLTLKWYKNMPKLFRDAHPLAPGGGLVAPERSYAPPFDTEAHIYHRTQSGNALTSSRRRSQRSHQLLSKESSFSTIDNNQIPEAFRRAHPEDSGEGLYPSSLSFAPNLDKRQLKNRSQQRNHRSNSQSSQKKSIGSRHRRIGRNSSDESSKVKNGMSAQQQSFGSTKSCQRLKSKKKSGKFRDRIVDQMIRRNSDSKK